MKIKKMYQGSVPENKIMSTYSSSNTDTYSCDYVNKVAGRSSCCCYLAGGAITGSEIRNYGTVFNSGDGFEVGTNKITIKKGVSRIRISANLNIQFSVSGVTYIRIFILKNGTEFMSNYAYTSGMTQWYYDTCSIPPIELDVNEGDVIEMKVTTQANGTIHNDQYGRSWIQVEAVSTEKTSLAVSGNNYSTNETVIGTYLDKPLYRKVYRGLSFGTLTGSWQTLTTAPSNIETLVDIYGSGTYHLRTYPRYESEDFYAQFDINGNNIRVMGKGYDGAELNLTIEYTKTTD